MTVFKRFDEDDIVRANPSEVSTGLWTGGTGSLVEFYTSATQTASLAGQYYFDVYNIDPASTLAEIQFSLAYGHFDGLGAPTLAEDDNALLPTQATYFQYRNILLNPEDAKFTFAAGSGSVSGESDDIFVINVRRARLKEKLDPGNWLLTLRSGPAVSGSGSFTFIDDSGQTLGETYGQAGRVFNVVSGSLTGVSGSTTVVSSSVAGGFGLVYPDVGIIVLHPAALTAVGIPIAIGGPAVTPPDVATGTVKGNQQLLLNSIISGSDFQARSAETVSSTHYFVRMRNKEFNYSNNPSFYNEANGAILNTNFIQDPQVYATTVGLYSDNNELLAVAKISQPLRKSFDREALVRVRLDF
jgi:hypothetical protein